MLQFTQRAYLASSHSSIRLLCVELGGAITPVADIIGEALGAVFSFEDSPGGKAWIAEGIPNQQVIEVIAALRMKGWTLLSHDVITSSQPSVSIPGGDSTILTRNYFFEKVGDIRSDGVAGSGTSFPVSTNVGLGVASSNGVDADGQRLLEEAVKLNQGPAAKKPPSPSKKVPRSPSSGSVEPPTVSPPMPPASTPSPSSSPKPAPKLNLNPREKDFFEQKKRAEEEAKRKEEAKLAAMDPQQRQEYEDLKAKSSAHDLAKSSHYERLGRMSVQHSAARGRGRGRGGAGRK